MVGVVIQPCASFWCHVVTVASLAAHAALGQNDSKMVAAAHSAACFPLQVLFGHVTGHLAEDLCCASAGWPLCWIGSGRSFQECCSSQSAHKGAFLDELGALPTRRAMFLASLEERAYPPVEVVMSPFGFNELNRRPSARFLARLLEASWCFEGTGGSVNVVEVGVQRGRFGHTLLTALSAATSTPGVATLRSRGPRRRQALQEWPSVVPEASPTWVTGPGCLRGRVSYFAVDSWQQQGPEYNDSANVRGNTQLANLRAALDLFAPFWPSVNIIQQASGMAARLFAKRSLHLVYLDARHECAEARDDLKTWWPLLQPGGFLAGHDFHTCAGKAVREFAIEKGVEITLVGDIEFLLQSPVS